MNVKCQHFWNRKLWGNKRVLKHFRPRSSSSEFRGEHSPIHLDDESVSKDSAVILTEILLRGACLQNTMRSFVPICFFLIIRLEFHCVIIVIVHVIYSDSYFLFWTLARVRVLTLLLTFKSNDDCSLAGALDLGEKYSELVNDLIPSCWCRSAIRSLFFEPVTFYFQ